MTKFLHLPQEVESQWQEELNKVLYQTFYKILFCREVAARMAFKKYGLSDIRWVVYNNGFDLDLVHYDGEKETLLWTLRVNLPKAGLADTINVEDIDLEPVQEISVTTKNFMENDEIISN